MPTLTIQLPGLPPVDHLLKDETMTIGRMKGNTIALDDSSVSLSHAKITRINGEFFLKDLNSTNGTMLNGQSINEARLRDGDQIKIGEVVAHYRAEPAFPQAATAAVPPAVSVTSSAPPIAAPQAAPPPQVLPAPSTTFVSKRLVTHATGLAQAKPQTNLAVSAPSAAAKISRPKSRANQSWVLPAIGGIAALIVAAVLGWMFFGGASGSANSTAPGNAASGKNRSDVGATQPPQSSRNEPTVADLVRSLKSSNPAVRRKAAADLHSRGSDAKEALPQLREALVDSDAEVRMWAALTLINNKSYDKGTIPILLQVLHHENSMFRQVACLSLALIPYSDAEKDPVVGALAETASKDSDEEVRKAAVSALKILSPEPATADK